MKKEGKKLKRKMKWGKPLEHLFSGKMNTIRNNEIIPTGLVSERLGKTAHLTNGEGSQLAVEPHRGTFISREQSPGSESEALTLGTLVEEEEVSACEAQ